LAFSQALVDKANHLVEKALFTQGLSQMTYPVARSDEQPFLK